MGKRPGQGDRTARGSAYMHVRVQVRRWPALDPVPGAAFRVRYCPGEIPAMVILEIENPRMPGLMPQKVPQNPPEIFHRLL